MIRYLSFACLGLAWVPITLLAGSSRRAPEDAPLKPGGTVTVHFVSTNDRTWWKGVKYPRLIQFTKNGVFLGSEGYLFEDRYLPRLFQQDKGEKERTRVVFVIMEITDPNGTPLPTLIRGVEKVRKAVPKGVNAVIFVRYNEARLKGK